MVHAAGRPRLLRRVVRRGRRVRRIHPAGPSGGVGAATGVGRRGRPGLHPRRRPARDDDRVDRRGRARARVGWLGRLEPTGGRALERHPLRARVSSERATPCASSSARWPARRSTRPSRPSRSTGSSSPARRQPPRGSCWARCARDAAPGRRRGGRGDPQLAGRGRRRPVPRARSARPRRSPRGSSSCPPRTWTPPATSDGA